MLLFSKASRKPVNSCNLLSPFVNYFHDVAKIKPRKFPAVEIHLAVTIFFKNANPTFDDESQNSICRDSRRRAVEETAWRKNME